MKVVLTQLNVGSKFRFMPSSANGTSISNYPRDGWLTEAAARKWAKANGHDIVKVEKVSGNGEKIHRYEVHYQATAPDGHIYSFIKEAVCTPGQLRGIMKTVEKDVYKDRLLTG